MSGEKSTFDEALSGAGLRIGIVQARFNSHIGDALREACVAQLKSLGVAEDDIEVVLVPGALEVLLALELLAESEDFSALVAIGCVMRGETYHFELVCNESARGITQVQLAHRIPIANAILTVENEAQAKARLDKGADAANVAVEMALLMDDLAE